MAIKTSLVYDGTLVPTVVEPEQTGATYIGVSWHNYLLCITTSKIL